LDVGSDRSGRDGWFGESTVYFININSIVGGGTCAYVGEGEHFPAFASWLEKREKRRRSATRSSTYPQAFLVNLPRHAIAEALMLALLIIETEPGADAGLGFGDCRISVKVDRLDLRLRHSRSTKMLSMHRPLPSMLIAIPWSFRVPVKSSPVNRLPWSVLKISGRP
jgi:hypothetical protein